jgi:hypothetical protein
MAAGIALMVLVDHLWATRDYTVGWSLVGGVTVLVVGWEAWRFGVAWRLRRRGGR